MVSSISSSGMGYSPLPASEFLTLESIKGYEKSINIYLDVLSGFHKTHGRYDIGILCQLEIELKIIKAKRPPNNTHFPQIDAFINELDKILLIIDRNNDCSCPSSLSSNTGVGSASFTNVFLLPSKIPTSSSIYSSPVPTIPSVPSHHYPHSYQAVAVPSSTYSSLSSTTPPIPPHHHQYPSYQAAPTSSPTYSSPVPTIPSVPSHHYPHSYQAVATSSSTYSSPSPTTSSIPLHHYHPHSYSYQVAPTTPPPLHSYPSSTQLSRYPITSHSVPTVAASPSTTVSHPFIAALSPPAITVSSSTVASISRDSSSSFVPSTLRQIVRESPGNGIAISYASVSGVSEPGTSTILVTDEQGHTYKMNKGERFKDFNNRLKHVLGEGILFINGCSIESHRDFKVLLNDILETYEAILLVELSKVDHKISYKKANQLLPQVVTPTLAPSEFRPIPISSVVVPTLEHLGRASLMDPIEGKGVFSSITSNFRIAVPSLLSRSPIFYSPGREVAEKLASEVLDRSMFSSSYTASANDIFNTLIDGNERLKLPYQLIDGERPSPALQALNLKLHASYRYKMTSFGLMPTFERSGGFNERYAVSLGQNGSDGLIAANYITNSIILFEAPANPDSDNPEFEGCKLANYQMAIEKGVQVQLVVAEALKCAGSNRVPAKGFNYLKMGDTPLRIRACCPRDKIMKDYTVTCISEKLESVLPANITEYSIFPRSRPGSLESPESIVIRTIEIKGPGGETKIFYQLLSDYISAAVGGFANTQNTVAFLKNFMASKGLVHSVEHPVILGCKTAIDRGGVFAAAFILDDLVQKKRSDLIAKGRSTSFENVFGPHFDIVNEFRLLALAIANRTQGTAAIHAMYETFLAGFLTNWDFRNKYGFGVGKEIDNDIKVFKKTLAISPGSRIATACRTINDYYRVCYEAIYNQGRSVLTVNSDSRYWGSSSSSSSSSSTSSTTA